MRRLFIIRKDLHLTAGKLAAMVSHCAEAYWLNLLMRSYVKDNEFDVLPVEIPGDPNYYENKKAEMPNWQLRVNGQKKAEGKFSEKFKTTMYKLKSEELMAGTNVFSIVCNNTTEKNANAWFNIDYWRFEVRRLPLPFVITIR
jgi:peptidyl-tRNA hydrolase